MSPSSACRLCLLVLGTAWLLVAPEAWAQRPLQTHDPFYRNETARREFYGGLALAGEVSYRPAGFAPSGAPSVNALGLSFRLDYNLASQVDVSAYLDAAGNGTGRPLSLSWVALKYFRTIENADYAFRLAVDPSTDGRGGFPQLDLGFLYSTLLTPLFSTDFALGARRVRAGFWEALQGENGAVVARRSRAVGWELHAMLGYNIIFDPAGSNLYVEVLGEGGNYTFVEVVTASASEQDLSLPGERFRGGVVWLRTGLELARPSYVFIPYLGTPLQQWAPDGGGWPGAGPHLGVRLMLR